MADPQTTVPEQFSVILSGRTLVFVVQCKDDGKAHDMRDVILGDIADFGKFTIAVGNVQNVGT